VCAATPIWPAGHRAALCLTFDVTAPNWEAYGVSDDDRYLLAQTAYEPAGLARILDLLADLSVQATFCWDGQAARLHSALVQRAVAEGHEIALRSSGRQSDEQLSVEDVRQGMREVFDTLTGLGEATPTGYKTAGGRVMSTTYAAAQELGLTWVMGEPVGDLPVLQRPGSPPSLVAHSEPDPERPPLVHLPCSWFNDDCTLFVRRFLTPNQVYEVWREEFDVIRAEGKLMCLSLHPFVIGRPGLSRALARFIDDVIDQGDVWIARAEYIARWWLERERDIERRLADDASDGRELR